MKPKLALWDMSGVDVVFDRGQVYGEGGFILYELFLDKFKDIIEFSNEENIVIMGKYIPHEGLYCVMDMVTSEEWESGILPPLSDRYLRYMNIIWNKKMKDVVTAQYVKCTTQEDIEKEMGASCQSEAALLIFDMDYDGFVLPMREGNV